MEMKSEKFQVVDNVKYYYASEWTHQLETQEHWQLYWQQQKLMDGIVQAGDKVLELGPGTGFCSNYLKSKGIHVTTLDIDEDKQADIHANIVTFTPDTTYDHILAFEVFEHIPYHNFLSVLKKLKNYCKNIFISVPVNELRIFILDVSLPVIKNVSFSLFIPRNRIIVPCHFWEVGFKQYKKNKLFQDIKSVGYSVSPAKKFKSRLFFRIH